VNVHTAAPIIDLASAMQHPKLFRPWFDGPSWDHWRAVLKAAFALPMTDAEREFFHTVAEREPPTKRVRELWCVVGRGGGKDSVASLIAAYVAALFEPGRKLRLGERALVMCLACDRDMAQIVLGYTRSYFAGIPPLRGMVVRETVTGFELNNGVISTNSFRSVRGRTLLLAILEECAFFRDERSSTPDEELYRAIRPGLARMPGSMLVGISTPYRKAGLLYRMFKETGRRAMTCWSSVRRRSRLIQRSTVRPLTVRLRKTLLGPPPNGTRVYDVSGWATRELIEAAVDRGVTVRSPVPGVRYP
jgi:hypothetical protein